MKSLERLVVPREFLLAMALFAGKLVYLGVVFGFLSQSGFAPIPSYALAWPKNSEPGVATTLSAWDGAHYFLLSTSGYSRGLPSCAFYPMWPIVLRAVSRLSPSAELAGALVSNLFSSLGFAIFYSTTRRRYGDAVAAWALGSLCLYPGSIFFQFPYSESLFLLLMMLVWMGLEEKRYLLVIVAGAVLPMTRSIGAFALIPIVISIVFPSSGANPLAGGLREGIAHLWNEMRPSQENGRVQFERLVACVAPVLGWFTYLGWMYYWTGNPFEGIAAQANWGRHSISNLLNLPSFLVELLTPTGFHGVAGSLIDRILFLLNLLAIPWLWRNDRLLLGWVYALSIAPAMSGRFTSYTRFSALNFPFFIFLGVILTQRKWFVQRALLVVVFGIVHLWLLWRFVNWQWAG